MTVSWLIVVLVYWRIVFRVGGLDACARVFMRVSGRKLGGIFYVVRCIDCLVWCEESCVTYQYP